MDDLNGEADQITNKLSFYEIHSYQC